MLNVAYFTAIILVFLRLVTFFVIVPVFFPNGTPSSVKIFFSLIFALIVIPGLDYTNVPLMTNLYDFSFACIMEVAMGLTLGFITNLCFQSAKIAGQFLDTQIGFSMMSIFDPNTNSNTTLMENLLYLLSIMIFLIIDGHHMLITSIMQSFSIIGLGKFTLMPGSILLIIQVFIQFFVLALKISIPITLVIMITDIIMGLISRTVPSLNILILGLPIKILIGLGCFMVSIPIIISMMTSGFNLLPAIYKSFYKTLPLLIVFAADDKTEDATPKKKSESRKKGQIARSKDVNLSLTLLACLLVMTVLGSYVGTTLKDTMTGFLTNYISTTLTYTSLQNIILVSVWRIALIVIPFILPIMVVGLIANLLQTGFLVTSEPLRPKLSKLNPISGFKKIFSKRTFVELFKDLIVVTLLSYVGYTFVKGNFNNIMNIGVLNIQQIPGNFGNLVLNIFFQVTLILMVIALIDFIYQKFMHNKDLKMTKQEIKEEFKQQEGDPQIKSKIRQKQREMSMRRMMQAVPKATVVITNPTHLAIALKYVEGEDKAPMIVAKGADYIAVKIKEIAKENNVPIIENRPLARLLYEKVEIDSEIPVDMYQAVAQVLAIVLKLKKQ